MLIREAAKKAVTWLKRRSRWLLNVIVWLRQGIAGLGAINLLALFAIFLSWQFFYGTCAAKTSTEEFGSSG